MITKEKDKVTKNKQHQEVTVSAGTPIKPIIPKKPSNNKIIRPTKAVHPSDFQSLKFTTLKQLDQWIYLYKTTPPILDKFRTPRESLSRHIKTKPNETAKLLVCHDFKGNYCANEDESPIGYFPHPSGEHYFVQYPSLIDEFIYFSHNRISIPPVSWTECLHKQGILSMGCILIEGDQYEEMDKLMTKDYKGRFLYVKWLVLLAERYRFDGWLINMETHFKEKSLANDMCLFTEELKSQMHLMNNLSKVVYYDSFIASRNKVWYQNGVNELNYDHFESADYFFTNYWWDEMHLKTTTSKIGFEGVKRKLYTGVDIWGRGTKIGTGGFETGMALNLIKHYGSNVALFAPGWTHENFQGDNDAFISNDQKFWIDDMNDESPGGGISHSVMHSTTPMFTCLDGNTFKFYSNFSQGEGLSYAVKGKTVFDEKWVNIALQSYTPFSLKQGSIEVEKYDPFNGGVSLKILHTPNTGLFNENQSIPLFKFHNEVLTSSIKLGLSYKYITLPKGQHFQLEITYFIERRYGTNQRVSQGVLNHGLDTLSTSTTSSDWTTSEIELPIPPLKPREHFMISGVQLRHIDPKILESNKFLDSSWIMIPKLPTLNTKKTDQVVILLGELTIYTAESTTLPITKLNKTELSTNQISISWDDDYENVLHWLVYVNGKCATVSSTPSWICVKLDRVRIDSVKRDGKVVKGHDLFV